MNILTLSPSARNLHISYFSGADPEPLFSMVFEDCRGSVEAGETADNIFAVIRERKCPFPDAAVMRIIYGGEHFRSPVLAGWDSLAELEKLVPLSPVQLPIALNIASALRNSQSELPLVLAFETGFFANLPAREQGYALSPGIFGNVRVHRFGFQGIFHEAAAEYARTLFAEKHGKRTMPAIISICLDSRPELAAILGDKVIMSTGGASPMQGLPGERSPIPSLAGQWPAWMEMARRSAGERR